MNITGVIRSCLKVIAICNALICASDHCLVYLCTGNNYELITPPQTHVHRLGIRLHYMLISLCKLWFSSPVGSITVEGSECSVSGELDAVEWYTNWYAQLQTNTSVSQKKSGIQMGVVIKCTRQSVCTSSIVRCTNVYSVLLSTIA